MWKGVGFHYRLSSLLFMPHRDAIVTSEYWLSNIINPKCKLKKYTAKFLLPFSDSWLLRLAQSKKEFFATENETWYFFNISHLSYSIIYFSSWKNSEIIILICFRPYYYYYYITILWVFNYLSILSQTKHNEFMAHLTTKKNKQHNYIYIYKVRWWLLVFTFKI